MKGRDLIYWKNDNIYLIETRTPLGKNFGNGGVSVKFEEAEAKKGFSSVLFGNGRTTLRGFTEPINMMTKGREFGTKAKAQDG